jgi:hypothetical protein
LQAALGPVAGAVIRHHVGGGRRAWRSRRRWPRGKQRRFAYVGRAVSGSVGAPRPGRLSPISGSHRGRKRRSTSCTPGKRRRRSPVRFLDRLIEMPEAKFSPGCEIVPRPGVQIARSTASLAPPRIFLARNARGSFRRDPAPHAGGRHLDGGAGVGCAKALVRDGFRLSGKCSWWNRAVHPLGR